MDQTSHSALGAAVPPSARRPLRTLADQPILLRDALMRDANNFDLIRLIAALMVIYGHAYSVVAQPGKQDSLLTLTGFATAGIAVKIFFFLSGVLVTNSLLEKKSVIEFVVARFFRIWPGLLFVLVGSAFVLGPLSTNRELGSYFSDPNTYLYIKRQLFMESWGTQSLGYYNLPGVFESNPYPRTVNASLWSLVVEVVAYIALVACFMVGLTSRIGALLLLGVVTLDAVLPFRLLFWFLPKGNEDFSNLPFCFAVGFAAAVFKDRVRISLYLPIGFGVLYWLFSGAEQSKLLFYLLVFGIVVWLATHPLLLRFRPKVDLSYGTFLWGFPIQQTLAIHIAAQGVLVNQIAAAVISMAIAFVSWTLIEKRSIRFGHVLGRRLGGRA